MGEEQLTDAAKVGWNAHAPADQPFERVSMKRGLNGETFEPRVATRRADADLGHLARGYGKLEFNGRLDASAVVGAGRGATTINEEEGTLLETNMAMTMGALGLGEQRGPDLVGRERARPLKRFRTSHGIVMGVYVSAEESSR